MIKNIETRKTEVKFSTSLIPEMFGKFLAEDVKRGWVEDFVDQDTKEIITLNRFEMIAKKGQLIDQDLIQRLNFYLQSGDITEIWVSNQQRAAHMVNYNGLTPWSVTAKVGKKKHKILLYANCIDMALEVAKDYIELNFDESFLIENARNFNDCIIIKDNLRRLDEAMADDSDDPENAIDKKFYKIDVKVTREPGDYTSTFVVHTSSVDMAMVHINNWIAESIARRNKDVQEPDNEFTSSIESAVVIPYSCSVDREFSQVYVKAYEEYK